MNRSVYIGYANTQNKTREFEEKNPVDKIHVIQTVYSFNAKSEISIRWNRSSDRKIRHTYALPLDHAYNTFRGVLSIYVAI